MKPQDVIDFFGGTQDGAADAIGVKQPSVSEWVKKGRIPRGRQFEIQYMTCGRLKVDPEFLNESEAA